MLNIVERKNKDNQTYIDCAMWLLRYFEMGGFHIHEDKKYGYYVYLEKNDENAELCNGNLIAITEHGIYIKRYNGIDKNGCNTFEGWKYFAKCDFTPEDKNFNLAQMRFYSHIVDNDWPEIAKKKMAVADKKIGIEKDFEN